MVKEYTKNAEKSLLTLDVEPVGILAQKCVFKTLFQNKKKRF